MQSLLIATGIVTLAETGDKTQIATIAMATHYTNPLNDQNRNNTRIAKRSNKLGGFISALLFISLPTLIFAIH